jgi:uncharacterized protein involved in exopolysaccharide biosynthesis
MTDLPSTTRENLRQAFKLANVVLRHRWVVVGLPVLAGLLSLATTMSRKRTYTASATFMTQNGPRPAASGLAAQFGLNVTGSGDPTLSPEFYADLVTSRPILERTVRSIYSVPAGDTMSRQTLVQYYGDENTALAQLRGGISTAIAQKTGVVSLSVRSSSPVMCRQLVAEILRQLDDFNKQRRKSRVSAERQFTEARMADAAAQLRVVEDSMQEFYTRNRDFEKSPELKFREERMVRGVGLRQQLYATLAQAYEQTKIDEVRDTPVITVLEDPALPTIGDSRHTVNRALLAVVMAFLFAVGYAFGLESIRNSRIETAAEVAEARSLGLQFLKEVRNPLGALRRLLT